METRKRLRLDEVVEMVQTDDANEEPMDADSDDEFSDMTVQCMEPDAEDVPAGNDVPEPACACK